jgi:hypothetical protein
MVPVTKVDQLGNGRTDERKQPRLWQRHPILWIFGGLAFLVALGYRPRKLLLSERDVILENGELPTMLLARAI